MERKNEKVLGYNVDLITFDDSVSYALDAMGNNKGMQIVTINPEMIEIANSNPVFARIIKEAELVVPDGSGIEFALKLKGIKQERIPGIDLAKELINSCNILNYPVALIGAKEDIIQTTVRKLKSEFQNLNICYYRNGYFTSKKGDEIVAEIANAEPKFVLIALGTPKQELFIKKCREKLSDAVYIGVGGSFDVWSGEVERAPEFFRIMGCEWLYRTFKQPERLKRIYKTLPMFLFKVIIEAMMK